VLRAEVDLLAQLLVLLQSTPGAVAVVDMVQVVLPLGLEGQVVVVAAMAELIA
jgi:hypothetical protein